MKLFPILFLAAILSSGALILVSSEATGEQIDSVELHGISERSGSILKTAVDTSSRTAYTTITWYLYTPTPVHITHAEGTDIRIERNIPAGYHKFQETYEVGSTQLSWRIDDLTLIYRLRITDSVSNIIPEEDLDFMVVSPDEWAAFMDWLRNSTILHTIVFLFIPAPFMLAYWKNRKSEGYHGVYFD